MDHYNKLEAGEPLETGDEYSTNGIWRIIPEFMVGDRIPDCEKTSWRRPNKDYQTKAKIKHKRWFQR
jgi:hypothetical protein